MRRAFTPYPVNSLALMAAEAALDDRAFSAPLRARGAGEPAASGARARAAGRARFSERRKFRAGGFRPGRAADWCARLARRGILVRDRAAEFGRDGFVRITAGTLRADAPPVACDRGGAVKFAPQAGDFRRGRRAGGRARLVSPLASSIRCIISRNAASTYAEIQQWKRQSGYNDDWRLTTDWVNQLGKKVEYAKVKRAVPEILLGRERQARQRWREKWLVPRAAPGALGQARGTGAFHGPHAARTCATRWSISAWPICSAAWLRWTTWSGSSPIPRALHFLLDGKPTRATALYLGDKLDDALAAQARGRAISGRASARQRSASRARRAVAPPRRAS